MRQHKLCLSVSITMFKLQTSTGNIVVMTKNTCYFTFDRVWNIHMENAENSISGPLDFKIFLGGMPPDPLEARASGVHSNPPPMHLKWLTISTGRSIYLPWEIHDILDDEHRNSGDPLASNSFGNIILHFSFIKLFSSNLEIWIPKETGDMLEIMLR